MQTDSLAGRRQQDEFVTFTLQVVCERKDSDRILEKVSHRAANTGGCIHAEVISAPRPLTDGEWPEVDETVNFLADMREELE